MFRQDPTYGCGCKNYWVLQKELGNSQYDRSCDVELSQKKLRRELALFFLNIYNLLIAYQEVGEKFLRASHQSEGMENRVT